MNKLILSGVTVLLLTGAPNSQLLLQVYHGFTDQPTIAMKFQGHVEVYPGAEGNELIPENATEK